MDEAPVVSGKTAAAPRPARELWADGKAALGCWCSMPSPLSAELVASAGFDWICIDLQHGLIDDETMVGMLQAAGRSPTSFVRVPWNDASAIMRALDGGADGVIVPMVNSAAEAAAAVGACRYAPEGYRSYGPRRSVLRDPDFGPRSANESVICAVMIETLEAVEHVDEILAVPGVDVAFVGPADLALSARGSLNAYGQTPRDLELIGAIIKSCERLGVVPGISQLGADHARRWCQAGFLMVAVNSDADLLTKALAEELAAARTQGLVPA